MGPVGLTSNAVTADSGAVGLSLVFDPITTQPIVALPDSNCATSGSISVLGFNGFGWEYKGQPCFSNAFSIRTSLAYQPNTSQLHVAYSSSALNTKVLCVKRLEGSSWVPVGSSPSSYALFPSLVFQPNTSEPFVAFKDYNIDGVTVKRFTGSTWESVGSAGFSPPGSATDVSLAFQPNSSIPYVAFSISKPYVMAFNGSDWEIVGGSYIGDMDARGLSLAFDPVSSQPTVAFKQAFSSAPYFPAVLSYDGSSWKRIGPANFTADSADLTTIMFNPVTSQPYLAFEDTATNFNVTVMAYDGTGWGNVGDAGFAGSVGSVSLAFKPNKSIPYVAYYDSSTYEVSVLRYGYTEPSPPAPLFPPPP